MNVALIRDGVVQNIAIFETLQDAVDMTEMFGMDEMVEATEECDIGALYQDGAFISTKSEPEPMESQEPTGPTEIDILNAKIAALTEHNNFLEECIVELALSLYE